MLAASNVNYFSQGVNDILDMHLEPKQREAPQGDYLEASKLGVVCSRALQYEYTHTPRDIWSSGKLLRIFEIDYAIEKMTLNWLRLIGFEIATHQENGEPLGFSTADGQIQGHVDGVIYNFCSRSGFEELSMPAIWECKAIDETFWHEIVEKGVKLYKPIYAVKIAIYQAYMEEKIPGISKNPAVFTTVNKASADIHHELVPFDAALAQAASDKAVNILRATKAGETLPRISADRKNLECRFCDWKYHCWKESI